MRRDALVHENHRQGGHVAEMQRRRLLSALVELLAEHGLEDAGVGRVCKRAGVSRRTFYDLFEDREACFIAAFDLATERLAQQVVPAFGSEGRWHQRVRSGLVALLESFDREPGLAQLCVVETLKAGPVALERRRRVLDALAAALDEGRDEAKGSSPPPLTAESTVGGVLSVIHARLIESHPRPLAELTGPLMSMIVHPYLGPAASRRELDRHAPVTASRSTGRGSSLSSDPFKDLPIRITFRTARVLDTIGQRPGASNREIGQMAGVGDQGQMSKLLRRLEKAGLLDNQGEGQARGEANAWRLTARGQGVLRAVGSEAGA